MASASSSCASVPNAPRNYDVFISFRGEDTRYNFTSHLHAALNQASLKVFRDDERLEKGHEIAPSLIQAIKDSSVSVIVFSEDYASSKWCLDELHQIMQYRKDEGQFVMPIFYKVDPSDVRNQTGAAYKKAFEEHERKHDHDKVSRWKAALSEAGKLCGWDCKTSTDESKLIQEIVADVRTKLERINHQRGTLKGLIGIDEMIKPIEELLEKSHKVGIWGMGGVGKTTMAEAVFTKLSYRYDNCCFLKNIREEAEKKNGSDHVRNSLISNLLGQDMQNKSSDAVAKILGSKKVLVVLDDVDSLVLLQDLQENICNLLTEGSRVIITTRDMRLLRANDYEIHEAKGLSYENSRQLFVSRAFKPDHPEDGYEELIKGFVCYTQHNPLALKVLGSLLRSEDDKKVWDDLLSKLRAGNPNDEIQKVLKLSYDILDHKEKQIFLDIACFLKGESEEFVKELLESYGYYPNIGMQTLKSKALIVTTNGKVDMHDLIQEMGRQIVREENRDDPGRRSRLWDHREICDILKNCEGEKEVEVIRMDTFENTGDLELTAKTFNKMTRLRFLKLYFVGTWMSDVPSSLESISTQIRYFHWVGYPMKSLPSNFCAKHLLELNLNCGDIEILWEGVQDLANLRRLNLHSCHNLRELPDFSKACRLESVDLSDCSSLCYVHASLLSLHSLISLDVSGCNSLYSTAAAILESISTRIRYFHWRGYQMKSLPSNFCAKHLLELNLSGSWVETLWEGVQDFPNLRRLNLGYCDNLRELPDFSKACRLENVNLNGCGSLCYVHASLLSLHSLISLDLSDCISLKSITARGLESIFTRIRYFCWSGYRGGGYPMKSLPSNFCAKHLVELNLGKSLVETLWEGVQDLPNLRRLDLQWCDNLRELPDFSKACGLESVDLNGCRSLCYVHESLLSLHSLISLDVSYCGQLKSLQSRIHLKSLKEIKIDSCNFKEFSVSSEALTTLNLNCAKIEELGPSIGLCSKLTTLFLVRCENLTELPDSITQISSLEELHLPMCRNLTKLPDNMRLLSKLQYLCVAECTVLRSLPELPPSLRKLDARECTSLETVYPSTISSTPQNKGKKFFSFNNCVKLDLGAIEEQVKLLLEKAVHEKEDVKVYYPGKKVPEWFGDNLKQNDSDTLKLCLSSHTLVGFVFGAVAPDLLNGSTGHLDIVFSVEEDEMTEEVFRFGEFTYGNVLLCSNPKSSESILEKIEGKRRNHDATNYKPNLSFELRFYLDMNDRCPTEEFGLYPIYASGNSRKRKAV